MVRNTSLEVVRHALEESKPDPNGKISALPLTFAPVSAVNWLRIRFLAGTHSLNSTLSHYSETGSSACPVCGSGKETVMHFLRDCSASGDYRQDHEKHLPSTFLISHPYHNACSSLAAKPRASCRVLKMREPIASWYPRHGSRDATV